uniref:Potassium channel domain-containing protein n=1 Tax=Caenorhabditis japonica TaxID=281687 RepID=A0A8R1DPB5_CAEJA
MMMSIGVYTIFGALVMRRLESNPMTPIEKQAEPSSMARVLEHQTRKRRRSNESEESTKQLSSHPVRRHIQNAAHIRRSRKCVLQIVKSMANLKCSIEKLDQSMLHHLDECYHVSIEHDLSNNDNNVVFKHSREDVAAEKSEEQIAEWSFTNSLLFSFTVITTIGYGNVAPLTFGGRIFVIFYGMIGIPFTLLAIADLGKFISEIIAATKTFCKKSWKKLRSIWLQNSHSIYLHYPKLSGSNDLKNAEEQILKIENEEYKIDNEESDELNETEALSLFILFVVYIAFGGMMLSAYEPDMDFFKAVYFNFVTLTSIGLGDIVPKSESYMLITIVYIAVGLALTTIAIEIAADALKRLHYFGRKMENVGNVAIWFGGKKITMKALVKNLGDHFNLPSTVVQNLNLDKFVEQAILVEEGELETLRPNSFDVPQESAQIDFADEPESEWIRDPTPTPTPSPEPSVEHRSLESELSLVVTSRTPSNLSIAIATPSTEESADEEVIIPSREETPETPQVETPETPKDTTPEEVEEKVVVIEEPTPLPPSPPPPPKPRPLTAAEIAAQKKKAYSEEAWRRYQEYQKQWKKFRQTQKTTGLEKHEGDKRPERSVRGAESSSRSPHYNSRTPRSNTPESKKHSPRSESSREGQNE